MFSPMQDVNSHTSSLKALSIRGYLCSILERRCLGNTFPRRFHEDEAAAARDKSSYCRSPKEAVLEICRICS